MDRPFQVGDRIVRLRGSYEGQTGVIVRIPDYTPDEDYTIHIRYDDPNINGGQIYRGYASWAKLIARGLPEESESIEA